MSKTGLIVNKTLFILKESKGFPSRGLIKNMRKRLLAGLLLTCILLLFMTSCGGVDSVASRLKKEGYTVRFYKEGTAPEGLLHEDLSARLSASGPRGEVLYMYVFKDKEKAIAYFEAIEEKYKSTPAMTAVRKGKTVYCGTLTAYRIVE